MDVVIATLRITSSEIPFSTKNTATGKNTIGDIYFEPAFLDNKKLRCYLKDRIIFRM